MDILICSLLFLAFVAGGIAIDYFEYKRKRKVEKRYEQYKKTRIRQND